MGKDGAGAVSWVETNGAVGWRERERQGDVRSRAACLISRMEAWERKRRVPQSHANMMRYLKTISDEGTEARQWSCDEQQPRRRGRGVRFISDLLRRDSRKTGISGGFYSPVKPTFGPQIASMPLSMTTSLY